MTNKSVTISGIKKESNFRCSPVNITIKKNILFWHQYAIDHIGNVIAWYYICNSDIGSIALCILTIHLPSFIHTFNSCPCIYFYSTVYCAPGISLARSLYNPSIFYD
jgi:hypothetical protein